MLNIVVPMAGAGSRFAKVGYKDPKPLIPVHGVPMIKLVIENLRPATPHRFIFICQKPHLEPFGLEAKLKAWGGTNTVITTVPGLTEGAACTVLTVKDIIDNDDALMIANCDQYIGSSIDDYLADMQRRNLDGLIMTLKSDHPKWSYAAIDGNGHATNVVEKKVISEHATVGIYNYRRGRDFVTAAEAMIAQNLRVNNEFYVAPVYNQLIAMGQKIGIYDIGTEMDGMYGIGTPEDLEAFLQLPISRHAAVFKGNI
jgi:dTDP-glucose pyrophosphorylase